MKDKALYHLLQLRARKLQEHIPIADKARLAEIQKTLRVQRDPGEYILHWQVAGHAFTLKTAGDAFSFYEKGDSAKSVARRGEKLNHRTVNWQAALDLWRQIFSISGLEKDVLVDDGSLAFGEFSPQKQDFGIRINLILSAFAGGIAMFKVPIGMAALVSVTTLLLLLLAQAYTRVQLRQPMRFFERILITGGSLLPILLHSYSVGLVGVTFGLYCLSEIERITKYRSALSFLAGMGFGIGAHTLAGVAFGSVATLWVLLAITSFIDRTRVQRMTVLLLLAGFLVATPQWSAVDVSFYYTDAPESYGFDTSLLNYSTLLMFAVLSLSFALWWIVGVQYYLSPWMFLFALAIAALVVYYRRMPLEQVTLLGYSGYVIFVVRRLIGGFVTRNSSGLKLRTGTG